MTGVCCCSCYNILKQKFNNHTADTWRELCACNKDYGPIIRLRGEMPELRNLESANYIKTHELPDEIRVIILGEKEDCMQQKLFCPGGNHV